MADGVHFRALNTKLAVIQVLMYEKHLLQPEFDVRAFVAAHEARRIDIDAEGHEPIPEVLAWFEALDVPEAMLERVDELYLDGGNEIYLQIAPRWDGEDGVFDITDRSDFWKLPRCRSFVNLDGDELDESGMGRARLRGAARALLRPRSTR